MYQRLANLNVDGASVNTGIHGGLGVKMKDYAPWVNVMHCFNYSLELAVKDTLIKLSLRKWIACFSKCFICIQKVLNV